MPLTRAWATSSHSDPNGGDCVEARAPPPRTVQVRDSKDPHGPALAFTATAWKAFTTTTKNH